MSVAFRRESDEEHLEPKFAIPLPPGPNMVTPRGLAQIEAKVIYWGAAIAAATDDPTRVSAKRDLAYWATRQSTARVAEPSAKGVIGIGTSVTFRLNGKESIIAIVGHDEADRAEGLVAFTAPLVKAMIGAGAGEAVDFAGNEGAIEVISVRPSSVPSS